MGLQAEAGSSPSGHRGDRAVFPVQRLGRGPRTAVGKQDPQPAPSSSTPISVPSQVSAWAPDGSRGAPLVWESGEAPGVASLDLRAEVWAGERQAKVREVSVAPGGWRVACKREPR